jgi:hypothetical protein
MVQDDASCGASCPTWPLHIAAGAARLRVAVDTPSREDTFAVEVINSAGAVVSSSATNNQFDAEAFIDKPAAGDWTIRVVPQDVSQASFRLRAKLEAVLPAKPAGKVALLPNLRAVPPMEFGFIAPANPLNGVYPPDTVNPPLDVAGVHPLSCATDEMAPVAFGGQGATKCLRLTSGPINIGAGPFDMRFDLAGDLAARTASPQANMTNTVTGPMQQAIHYSDGTITLRPAGTYSWHTTHGHFHTDQILTYELFAVTDPVHGTIKQESGGTKSGFCPADQLFGEWRRFSQNPQGDFGEGDSAGGNCFSPSKGVLGLTPGWGDVYRWQRPGQFVEFDHGDGLYVVRTTVDKGNRVLESDETDNASYAYVSVKGEKIDLLERGQGTDPWDPRKTVFRGSGPARVDDLGPDPAAAAGIDAVPAANPSAGTAATVAAAQTGRLPATGGPMPVRTAFALAGGGLAVGLLTRPRRRLRPSLRPRN